jgi:hypothetical protein
LNATLNQPVRSIFRQAPRHGAFLSISIRFTPAAAGVKRPFHPFTRPT